MARQKSNAVLALEEKSDELRDFFGVPDGEKLPPNHLAWMKIFREREALEELSSSGAVRITPTEIKNCTGMEPRIIAKHDFGSQRPWVFRKHKLSILPLSTTEYVIGKFNTFEKFPQDMESVPVENLPFPGDIESIDYHNLTSEAVQVNAAYIGGIFSNFLGEESLEHTLSGRMSSGSFDINLQGHNPMTIAGSQIEIDGGYEGARCLAIVEAKNRLSDDFNTRQLYYPYRRFRPVVRSKELRNIYQVFSDGIFNLYEYKFDVPYDFTSIRLVNKKRYSLSSEAILLRELEHLAHVACDVLPGGTVAPFPQANSFARVVNLCEFIARQGIVTKQDVYIENGFTSRQADYYANAGAYLGLLSIDDDSICLTKTGKQIMEMESHKQRKLAFASKILSDDVFKQIFLDYQKLGYAPSESRVIQVMRGACLVDKKGRLLGDETLKRRSNTVLSWVKWVRNLASG